MAKKGAKGKKKKEVDPNLLTEVDKTYYELQIADLCRKLARLRSTNEELEEKNKELIESKDQLDEDRNDIIMYLKRMLKEKTDEVAQLAERITALQETRQKETEQFETTIVEMKAEYKAMHDQLTSEIKLLEGKLGSLEEFRSMRDVLMKKFETQENEFEAQEKRHKRELYQIERKFIISKDQLKKDMEARLLQLSTEFQDATELRIAATTKRVIRENIAVNNELDILLSQQQMLYNENVSIKKMGATRRQEAELHEREKKMALAKAKVQTNIIERLTDDYNFMKKKLQQYKQYEEEILKTRNERRDLENKIANCEYKIKLLEQNLHNARCERTSIQTDYLYLVDEKERLSQILLEAVSCIKEAFSVKSDSDMAIRATKRENLMATLHALLTKAKEEKIRRASVETISSLDETYTRGDLGFVPKPVEIRSKVPIKINMESQTGASFDEYVFYGEVKEQPKKTCLEIGEEETEYEEEEEEEGIKPPSLIFFDEQTMVAEDTGSADYDVFLKDMEERDHELTTTKSAISKKSEVTLRPEKAPAPEDTEKELNAEPDENKKDEPEEKPAESTAEETDTTVDQSETE